MVDLTKCGNNELVLIVSNDEFLYHMTEKPGTLLMNIDNAYHYTKEQLDELLEYLKETK